MKSVGAKQKKESSLTDHGLALVPLGAGYHQSPDVLAQGRSVDTGLLAESLIYYDRVLINVDNPVRFADLISLLVQQGLSTADIIALIRDGTLQVLHFAFTTNPYVEFREDRLSIHGLYNFQDNQLLKPNSFFERFLGFERLKTCFSDRSDFDEFCRVLEGRVIEIKADDIGSAAIDNAYQDFLDPERNQLMSQELVNEIYKIRKMGKAPKLRVAINPTPDGAYEIRWNIPMHQLPAVDADTNIKAAGTLPLSTAAEANKYLWASKRSKCDLYLSSPMSTTVGNKLFEASTIEETSAIQVRRLVETLEARVEFPDLRSYVNNDRIDFDHILRIRRKAKKFRTWLQTEAERDRDAIVAYHNEVAKASGFAGIARRSLKLFSFVSGSILGGTIGREVGTTAAGAIAGHLTQKGIEKGVEYLFDLAGNLGAEWTPVVFGKWYRNKIEILLDKNR
jgi:hypothetical protein